MNESLRVKMFFRAKWDNTSRRLGRGRQGGEEKSINQKQNLQTTNFLNDKKICLFSTHHKTSDEKEGEDKAKICLEM